MKRTAIFLIGVSVGSMLGAIWAGPSYRWQFALTAVLLGGISLITWGMIWNKEAKDREEAEAFLIKSVEALRREVTGEAN